MRLDFCLRIHEAREVSKGKRKKKEKDNEKETNKEKENEKETNKEKEQRIDKIVNCPGQPDTCTCGFHVAKRAIEEPTTYEAEVEMSSLENVSSIQKNQSVAVKEFGKSKDVRDRKEEERQQRQPQDKPRNVELFYSDEELRHMDENFIFGPVLTEQELYKRLAPKLSFENLTVRCCAVCDCGTKCNQLSYEEISEPLIEVT